MQWVIQETVACEILIAVSAMTAVPQNQTQNNNNLQTQNNGYGGRRTGSFITDCGRCGKSHMSKACCVYGQSCRGRGGPDTSSLSVALADLSSVLWWSHPRWGFCTIAISGPCLRGLFGLIVQIFSPCFFWWVSQTGFYWTQGPWHQLSQLNH